MVVVVVVVVLLLLLLLCPRTQTWEWAAEVAGSSTPRLKGRKLNRQACLLSSVCSFLS